ncbi:hypothetical protein VTK73DRAFT_7647 [Phialemonium thermophilum]|uniref:CCAAT-binding factor domain-containing protein n=1 Tax=Phialemonium thermophilum TaxID=223376 RepID=A0ABR3Y749_9PEZI
MGPKRKNKKQEAAPQVFDEAAFQASIAQLDKSLAKTLGNDHSGKRKRQDGNAESRAPKKRHTDINVSVSKKDNKGKGAVKRPSTTLLDEIKALGGDERDLELIANIDSDVEDGSTEEEVQELGTNTRLDKSFRDELAKFASSLGFENVPQDDGETDGSVVEEDQSDVEGQNDDDDDLSVDAARGDEPLSAPQKETHRKKAGNLIFEPIPDWYTLNTDGFPSPLSDDIKSYSSAIVNLKSYAQSLLEEDASAYSAIQASSSTHKFMSTIMSSGTLSDRVSALTLAVQESPVHNVKAFESLINLAGKKSRGHAISALGALVDLLGNGVVLPSDRRLRTFETQPRLIGTLQQGSVRNWSLGQKLPGRIDRSHLIMWVYEDWLKDAYFRIIQLLEVWCRDEVPYSRSRALDFVFGLLKSKPEQEANLLRLLVNKLGDRERKIASRASYLLLQLLNVHPGMKPIVIKTIDEEVLLRPGQNMRAKYFAINTLNQTILSMKEPEIADSLLRIYFDLFLALLKSGSLGILDSFDGPKNGKVDPKGKPKRSRAQVTGQGNEQDTTQKLVSALLTGVNRALPFTTTDNVTLEKHLDTLFKITHSSNFNTSIQALMLIQQLASSKHLAVDRFYRTLYESLLDPRLITSSKQALYLNLLYRSLKNDISVRRVKAFVKRILQILNLHQPSFACGALFLIGELEILFPDLKTLLNEPEENDEDEEEVYKDVVEEDNEAPQPASNNLSEAERRKQAYDGRKRDPEYSNADKSCLWELMPFLSHFHPSVCVFAANLLTREKTLPKPDLANHTLIHFLDKFVYRNAKTTEAQRGSSIMQPVRTTNNADIVALPGKATTKKQAPVNSAAFWNLKPEQVAAEDVFFHEYFSQVGKAAQAARKAKKAHKAAGSEDEDEGEDEIWDALVNSRPEVGGDDGAGDSDFDMDLDDGSDVSLDLESKSEGDDQSELGSENAGGEDDGFEGIFGDSDESSGEEDSEDESPVVPTKGNKGGASGKGRLTRKERKSLPTFASAEDYAEMLAAEDDLDD